MKNFALSTCAVILLSAAVTHGQQKAPARSYQEGESWRFRVDAAQRSLYESERLVSGIYEIVYSQGRLRAFYAAPTEREELVPIPELLMFLLGEGKEFSFPLAVGKTWSWRYALLFRTLVQTGVRFYWRDVDVNVSGTEQIKTAAGTFESYKLVKEDRLASGSSRWLTTYYFSPDTQSVIRMTSNQGGRMQIVLIRHTRTSDKSDAVASSIGELPLIEERPAMEDVPAQLEN